MESICHYTSAETAIEILRSGIFKFGKLENSNDPFEKLRHRYIRDGNTSQKSLEFLSIVDNFISTYLSRACFSKTRTIIPSEYKAILWAHYAKNHTGVCFVFDQYQIIHALKITQVRFLQNDIEYSKFPPFLPDEIFKYRDLLIPDLIGKFDKYLLFTKHEDWLPENEYRIVVFEEGYSIPINKCLRQVLLGPEIEPISQKTIESIMNQKKKSKILGNINYSWGGSYAKSGNLMIDDLLH